MREHKRSDRQTPMVTDALHSTKRRTTLVRTSLTLMFFVRQLADQRCLKTLATRPRRGVSCEDWAAAQSVCPPVRQHDTAQHAASQLLWGHL